MRHPFDGLNLPENSGMTRRTALGAMAAAAAGALGLAGTARAQVRLTEAIGEGGGPVTGALREGGFTRALRETGIGFGFIPVKPDTQELKDEQFKTIWGEMADKDAVKGVQACAELYGAKKVVPFLKENLKADK